MYSPPLSSARAIGMIVVGWRRLLGSRRFWSSPHRVVPVGLLCFVSVTLVRP